MYADIETLWRTTIEQNTECWMAYNNLGLIKNNQGNRDEAIIDYDRALQLNPAFAEAHDNLGGALLQLGQIEEAINQFHLAVQVKPTDADARCNLGNALFQQGHVEEAIAQFDEALLINPANAEALNNLGNALFQQGRTAEAIAQYRAALVINPDYANAYCNLVNALRSQGQTAEAVAQCRKAYQIKPGNLVIQNQLAWLLATVPEASLRDGYLALKLAVKASQTPAGSNNPLILRTLAAAYAETGDFANAMQTAHRALQLAGANSESDLANALRREIKFYEVGHPFRDRQ